MRVTLILHVHVCLVAQLCPTLSVHACIVSIWHAYMHAQSLQSCPTLCDPVDCRPPGSSVHGILQARILEWVAVPSRGPCWPRIKPWVSYVADRFFTIWAIREASITVEHKHGFSSFLHWRWSWNSTTLATFCGELTLLKRPWCWERLRAGGEGDDRGWDGWMASPTQWTWVWVDSGSWWWTGRPGVLRFMGLQRVGHDWATELNWTLWYYVNQDMWMLSPKPSP